MRQRRRVVGILAALFLVLGILAGCAGSGGSGSGIVTLNVAVAGDTNMQEFYAKAIAEEFQQKHTSIKLNVVGTGPGDAGSNAIFTKLEAQQKAGTEKWDLDVAIIHQSIMGPMLEKQLLRKYVSELSNRALVVGDGAKMALGTDVEGYVVPMFQSQIAIAYNSELVKNPPGSYADLANWIKANPNKFGYNGVKGGASGVGFTAGWVYWKTNEYDHLALKGPYNPNKKATWSAALKELKALPVVITNGNNGTLDMLNRGEILMGPVWVDMYYNWLREGRMNPKIKVRLIEPGLPGQPMYFTIPAKAANVEAAKKFIDFMASPDVQAKFIVERNGWYPGVDAEKVMPRVSQEAKDKLFASISADDLKKYGRMFMLAPYHKDVQAAYEEN